MRIRPAVAAVLAAATLATASCAGGTDPDRAPVAQAGPATSGTAAPPAGAPVQSSPVPVAEILKFKGRTLTGETFDGASLAGRPVVLWFWAPWCATCAGQAASIRDMVAAHAQQVAIVGVAGLGDEAAMHDFVGDFELAGVTQINDQKGEIWRRFEVTEQSTYVFLDRVGRMTHRGWLDSLQFETAVAAFAAG